MYAMQCDADCKKPVNHAKPRCQKYAAYKYKGKNYCRAHYLDLIELDYERIAANIVELTDALQCLYDEQQGPPLELPRHKASWQAAMDKASKLLEASND